MAFSSDSSTQSPMPAKKHKSVDEFCCCWLECNNEQSGGSIPQPLTPQLFDDWLDVFEVYNLLRNSSNVTGNKHVAISG